MKVTLLNHAMPAQMEHANHTFYDHEYLVQQAAAICVDKLDNPTEKGMKNAIDSGHLSIIEHLPLTFLVEDVSRALTHQLVRHRIASYSQQSQRYAKVDVHSDEKWYVIPPSITKDEYALREFLDCMKACEKAYFNLEQMGIKGEDARFVLPNACHTAIIVTMNARAFIEAGQKRICNKAQWEIRAMFRQMRTLIKDIYPTVYDLTKPNCLKGGCTEKKPCGNPYTE